MNIGLYTDSGTLITRMLVSVVPTPNVITIRNRTLDGRWHIQSIGDASLTVRVQGNLKPDEKDKLDLVYSNSELLYVIFDDKTYRGFIDEQIEYERVPFSEYPIFATSFNMLVVEEDII